MIICDSVIVLGPPFTNSSVIEPGSRIVYSNVKLSNWILSSFKDILVGGVYINRIIINNILDAIDWEYFRRILYQHYINWIRIQH